ncbi:MAG: hypothetical protein HFH56_01370 [Lachnospiraceae bacterium]|nr:hypothetical protein [Lachnospiraceae bacterium]
MKREELFPVLAERFRKIIEENDLTGRQVSIACRALSAQEAIGETKRKDFPLLHGKEVMMQAEFDGGVGQAFTSTPSAFEGTLEEILALDIAGNDYDRAIFIAALNAVMAWLGLCDRSVHCREDGPEKCAVKIADTLLETYGKVRIAQIGYQPALLERLSEKFEMRLLDLDPDRIGKTKFGVQICDGVKDYEDTVLNWAELVLCTGSTLSNATIADYMDLDKEVLFYGTTVAGAASLLGLKRICHGTTCVF